MQIELNENIVSMAALFLRLGVGIMMLVHGIPKLQMLFSGDIQFPGVMGLNPTLSLVLAVISEVLCSILPLIGLFTRIAAIPLIITMLVAVLIIHGSDPYAMKELGLFYLLAYVV
ncbi:MAG TPA: DoxX family protein, partial [Xanthomarina gelatinilytica]|nr:DoxX family protein [Xanthomarina gelatinilytica]